MLPLFRPVRWFCTSPHHRLMTCLGVALLISACSAQREPAAEPVAQAAPQPKPTTGDQGVELAGRVFGTTWSAKARGEGLDQSQLLAAVKAEFKAINQGMSTWQKDSSISTFNRAAAGPFVWGERSIEVIKRSFEIAKHTQGAFDPTVGPLIGLWGFGAKARTTLPKPDELTAARRLVGYTKLRWGKPGELIKADAGMRLDLSAIAKGYAVDRVAGIFKTAGAQHGMVEIGGEVVAWGERAQGGAWKLAVDAPVDGAAPGKRFAAIVKLADSAMATSGDYRQFRIENGRRVQHIVDPRTGEPVVHRLASVTVIAKDCATADAYATALMVMGDEKGLKFVDSDPDLEALFLVRDQQDWRQVYSRNMKKYLIQTGTD